ncbi:hypothetical protein BV898_09172 [Hypsibius exemplaris]|uniref:Chitin-binding type-2 domain-containing protein n=1 Tax=Hypsibius exemplaris TaxID=2072580 RepID=A0A1W0WN62_HYPEX|nr:hypothetical protein BV898_09172 [Hypsibius exemplaris]
MAATWSGHTLIAVLSVVCFLSNNLTSAVQFPWAESPLNATESTVSVFDLRVPDFSTEQVQLFLNQTVAGRDYPDFHTIPVTNFTCRQVEQPGYYADPDTGCQVYRRCAPDGTMFSYLCGEQTVFDQLLLTCDFFYKVNCNISVAYYNYVNMHMYKSGQSVG